MKKVFDKVATITDLNIITDNAGKAKGFAFAFIKEKENIDGIIKSLNGSELLGRKIRVDLAQQKKKNNDGKKPQKSSRELRAIREEEEDSKKRNRRPRPKKD